VSESATAETERDRSWRDVVFDGAPLAASATAFIVGATTLIAAVTPALPTIQGLDAFERLIDEAPEFTASAASVALMALALGLRRRIDAAWMGACALLAFLAAYAIWRHEHYAAAAVCTVAFAALVVSRHAFFRHAALMSFTPSRPWYFAIAAAFTAAAIGGILWAGEKQGFAEAPWWALILDERLGRPGRAFAIAAAALAALMLWRLLLTPAASHPPLAGADDLARAEAITATAEAPRPEAALAFLGDKSFLFAEGAFLMYARAGGSLIAMGGPIGPRSGWRGALSSFRAEAERLGVRPVIYGAAVELLPSLLDLGFKVEKVGENAVVDLKAFSMSGKKRQDLRTARRRLVEKEGAAFEVVVGHHDPALMGPLETISRAWLDEHKGEEKGFSLGRFDTDFLQRGPLALVRLHGQIVAFASLWTTHDHSWVSVDLMRYDPARAPHGLMDFLFTEMLLWAQGEGYARFDLGMAPLSGLAEERHAPLFAHLGRFVFERAGALYNFQGLRKFKEKYASEWEPRYIAAPGAWSLPIVLAEAAMLTSRGVKAP
jgi:lysylphosphatidylglycerol synthetase-like protein (DUF2156 family)